MIERKAREDEYRALLREGRRMRLLWRLALTALCFFGCTAVVFIALGDFVEGLILTLTAAFVWIGWVQYSHGPVRSYRERVETQRKWVEAQKMDADRSQE
jgi:hypothetical protein